jgi:hypothetical protein
MTISVLCSKYSQQVLSASFPIHFKLKLQAVPLSRVKNLLHRTALHLTLKNYTATSSMPGVTGIARDNSFGPTPEGQATKQ